MKKLLLLLAFLPFFSFAQEYVEVVEVPGKNTDQIYATAREWFAQTFNSANNVLQMDDPISGKLIGKGTTHVSESYVTGGLGSIPITMDWYPNFTIKVSIKEGKYKCEITDILIKSSMSVNNYSQIETPFKLYLEQKEYYKNASDPDWLINNSPNGAKVGKVAARISALTFKAIYNLTIETEEDMKNIIVKLQNKMKSTEENW